MVVHRRGFIIASKNAGYLNVYEIDKQYAISLVDSYQCKEATSITSMALSFDRVYLVFGAYIEQKKKVYGEGEEAPKHEVKSRVELY
jgi:hypothetical protein